MKRVFKLLLALRDKEILNYSASLSFYSILSLIPILFVCFSVFTQIPSFEAHYERAKSVIFTFLIPAQQDLVASYLDTFLKNSVNLGIMGLIAMAFTSLAFFSGYDFVINRITQNEPKGLWASISSYWTLLTLVPLGLGLSFYVSSLIQKALDDYHIGFNFFEILPFVIIWALFFISYSSSLHQVSLKNLALTSFCAGAIWYAGKNLFVYYVVYNKTYASVYGSFSTILFFFIWIYISWVIYLYGLKICFFLNENERDKIKQNAKKRQNSKINSKQTK
ncbi:TPA: YihY/virulence factor BrkB family protein [Campylobacter upsaliensis]|uniref:YihY/virulence factor BrkB family protein n=1 Tax=Campylobacter upsaliensis TaxID=28080 RepID=UPI0022EB9F66|nr:YihY/virulence factor BrkB family protein [Campylobacter upsaliensis]MEB2788948.1 YihY/virulence factor BrkB family protein [Campylobacter upsaliensis]MEB2798017.1 YihY/virulence factor BrkB family protein [Campylobacter upsaliensis]HEC1542167.1 YihY/virulence factor BrkB family protein [Campylobacter upsaliensis]HEC1554961.1 YihY/virulence factor BrkB family protein [Campylobacter upsaliensis]HEC1559822.1 YihY/virulence factor BrkB family protein [Campylobacter upsaliensis]